MLGLVFLFLLKVSCSYNLIIKGDFETYKTLPWSYGSLIYKGKTFAYKFSWVSSNVSNWYDKLKGQIQIQQSFAQFTTNAVDLSSSFPITLCQDVILSVGSKYTLSFDLYSTLKCSKMTGRAYLNNLLLTQIYIERNSTFKTQVYSFYAYRNFISFCFNDRHSGAPPFAYNPGIGGLIDNISLVLVQKVYIMFNFIVNQIQNTLFLEANQTFNNILVNQIENSYDLLINNESIQYKIVCSENQNLLIQINKNYSFNMESVKFTISNNSISLNSTSIEIYLSYPMKKYFLNLKYNEILVLEASKNILVVINKIYSKVSALSQIFLFAYFVNIIIDIQFLSLFYVFTQIIVIPLFTSKIYYEILQIIFSTESLIEYLSNLLKISWGNLQIPVQNSFSERIEKEKNSQPWLGAYNLSSKVIKSNFNFILILALSFVKSCLLKLILKLFSLCFPSFFKINFSIYSVILRQFCFMSPVLLISLSANMINSLNNFIQKGYKAACLFLIFVNLILLFIYIFLPSFNRNKLRIQMLIKSQIKISKSEETIFQKEENRKINEQNKVQQIKMREKKNIKMKILYNDEAFSAFLIYFIPLASLISNSNSKLFLMLNTFSVLFRFCNFLQNNHQKDLLIQRVISFMIGLIWLFHHTIFLVFLFYEDIDLSQTQIQMIIYLGVAAVMTVTAIIILQSLKVILQGFVFIKNCLQFFILSPDKTTQSQKLQQPLKKKKLILIQNIDNQQKLQQRDKKNKIYDVPTPIEEFYIKRMQNKKNESMLKK